MAKTKPKEIVEYWSTHQSEEGLSVDWADALDRCWRCAETPSTSRGSRPLELCHIVPAALGGRDEPSNFVLLCWRCHRESPNVSDPSYMWTWLRAHAQSFYETYWMMRATEEFQKMFGFEPGKMLLDHVMQSGLTEDEVIARYKEALSGIHRRVAVHWGEGHLNPTTFACLMHMAEADAVQNWHND